MYFLKPQFNSTHYDMLQKLNGSPDKHICLQVPGYNSDTCIDRFPFAQRREVKMSQRIFSVKD